MTRIYLIRHGETVWNKAMKYQGHTDVELTELGYEQARKVGLRLAKEPIQAVYSSDLGRALETAKAIAVHHDLQPQIIPELKEMNFGVWEGMTYDEISQSFSAELARWYTQPCSVTIPDAETFEQVKERAYGALMRIVELNRDKTIALVSHGGTIRTLLCGVLDLDLNHVWRIKQDNTAVNLLEFFAGRVVVALVNDTHHLAVSN